MARWKWLQDLTRNNETTVSCPHYCEIHQDETRIHENGGSEEDSEDRERGSSIKQTSGLQAAWNISNLVQGTGTLGIPYAVMKGGYLSLGAIILVAVISNYTGKLIIECLYDKPIDKDGMRGTRQRKSYAQIGEACWQKHGSTLVSAVQVMHITFICVMYVMLVAEFFNTLLERYVLPLSIWLILAGVLVLPSIFLNQMTHVSFLSMFSVFSLILVFCSVIGYGLTQHHAWDFHMPLTTFQGFPVSWSIILYSFGCNHCLPAIEEAMAQPDKFNSVMNYSFLVSTVTKILFGFIAVLTFKQNIQQEISANLPAGALENTVNAFLCLTGLLSYALPSFTLFTIIHKANLSLIPPCFSNEEYPLSTRERMLINGLRMLFVVITVAISVLLPQFSLLMAVAGSISSVCIQLVFPCLFDIVLHRDHITTRRYVINVLIICVGVLSGGFGFVTTVIAIVKANATAE